MDKIYLIILLLTPLICASFQLIWGFENNKEHELVKAIISKSVYYLQFAVSLIALFIIRDDKKISFTFVHLDSYHYDLMFHIKSLHLGFAIIFSLLFILTEKLSFNYLHGEEEHAKFYSLKMILNFAAMSFVFSSNIDFLFFNWELVGISSALLISYFYRRNQAVESSLFAFSIYRICDAAFLLTGLLLFYFYKTENIETLGSGYPATILGILIFISIMGKSGAYPFSAWLPQALEGPTPSSNLYYMTLSTHLGAVFLIKTSALWDTSLVTKMMIIGVSLITIITSSLSARTQTTIKGALAYSALGQVSLILIEVALGYHILAIIHLGLHIFYRLAQMSISPSIIDRHNLMENMNLELSTNKTHGKFYFLAINGFRSEKITKSFLSILLIPFEILNRIELSLVQYLHQDKQKESFVKATLNEVKNENR